MADLIKDFQINLDLITRQTNPIIQVSESDLNSVRFTFQVLDGGVKVDLTGASVILAVKKPSGLTVVQDCTITDALNGICTVILMNQAYIEIGNHTGELLITKDDSITITRSFDYSSLDAILDDDTIQSANDWQVLQELMFNYDLKPIFGEGSPNGVVTPEYAGQTYLDTLGPLMYFSSTTANDSWLPFGASAVDWTNILGKPSSFTPSVHTHLWADITDKPTTFTPSAHVHTMTDVTGLNTALTGKSDTGHTHAYADITGKPSTFTPSAHTHLWVDITDKPTTFTPSAHTHPWTEVTGKPTTFAPSAHTHLWADLTDKPATFTPIAHTHPWTEVTSKPTTFTPSAHTHLWADIIDKPTTFTPTLMSGAAVGGAQVGNGLGMSGNYLYVKTLSADGTKIDGVNNTIAIDRTTVDTWYARTTQNLAIWKGTQAAYDAIGTKDANTLYFISG